MRISDYGLRYSELPPAHCSAAASGFWGVVVVVGGGGASLRESLLLLLRSASSVSCPLPIQRPEDRYPSHFRYYSSRLLVPEVRRNLDAPSAETAD